MNMTLLDKLRFMLFSSGLSKSFRGEAVMTTTYLINKIPSSALEFKTSEHEWSGKAPDLCHLRVFGCTAFAHQRERN